MSVITLAPDDFFFFYLEYNARSEKQTYRDKFKHNATTVSNAGTEQNKTTKIIQLNP
jgi:hypothetical protein